MTGYRIPPLKVTAYTEFAATDRLTLRAQGLLSGDHDYRLDGVASVGRRNVTQYTAFGVLARYRAPDTALITVGVENVFNEQYLPVCIELLRNNLNTSRVPAAGTTFTVAYRRQWKCEYTYWSTC